MKRLLVIIVGFMVIGGSSVRALNARTADTAPELQLWNTLNQYGLKLYQNPGVYHHVAPWQVVYEGREHDFDAMYHSLPLKYRNAKAYVVGYGSIAPVIPHEPNRDVLDILNEGMVLAPELLPLHAYGTHLIYGHSSSIVNSDFSAVLLPMMLLGAEGSTFSIYVRQYDGSYVQRQYSMEKTFLDVDPSDVSIIENYQKKGGDYVVFVGCRSGNLIGALAHRQLLVAKAVDQNTPNIMMYDTLGDAIKLRVQFALSRAYESNPSSLGFVVRNLHKLSRNSQLAPYEKMLIHYIIDTSLSLHDNGSVLD